MLFNGDIKTVTDCQLWYVFIMACGGVFDKRDILVEASFVTAKTSLSIPYPHINVVKGCACLGCH